jgi:hypothetical protein
VDHITVWILCSTSAFQCQMESIFGEMIKRFCFIYIDDMIYSKTEQDHLKHLGAIFEALEGVGLRLNEKKCRFGFHGLNFLGHLISHKGLEDAHGMIHVQRLIHQEDYCKCMILKFNTGPKVNKCRLSIKIHWSCADS